MEKNSEHEVDWSLSEPFFFLNNSRTNSKTSKVNQQSLLNLLIFPNLPKNLDRTITSNSTCHSQKYTDRTSKYIYFFSTKQIIYGVSG